MRRITIPAGFLLCFVASYALGCWQTEQPPVVVRAASLNVRVTDNDKPKTHTAFELHKAISFDPGDAQQQVAYQREILKSAAADSAGMLSLGKVNPGRYWIVYGATRSDWIAVEVHSPNTNVPHQGLWVKYYADGCRDVVAENMK